MVPFFFGNAKFAASIGQRSHPGKGSKLFHPHNVQEMCLKTER